MPQKRSTVNLRSSLFTIFPCFLNEWRGWCDGRVTAFVVEPAWIMVSILVAILELSEVELLLV